MHRIPLWPGSCTWRRWLRCTSSQLQARATNKADLTHLPECAESLLGLDFACGIDDSGVRRLNLLARATNQADLTHLPECAESLLGLDLARGIDDSGVRCLTRTCHNLKVSSVVLNKMRLNILKKLTNLFFSIQLTRCVWQNFKTAVHEIYTNVNCNMASAYILSLVLIITDIK